MYIIVITLSEFKYILLIIVLYRIVYYGLLKLLVYFRADLHESSFYLADIYCRVQTLANIHYNIRP